MTNQDIKIIKRWLLNKSTRPRDFVRSGFYRDNPVTRAYDFNKTIKWLDSYVQFKCFREKHCKFIYEVDHMMKMYYWAIQINGKTIN